MASTPDVLSSPPATRRRRWAALAAALAVTAAGLVLVVGGDGDDEELAAPPAAASAAPPAGRPGPTSATIDPADRVTGSLPGPAGLPTGTTAIEAAREVADSYCDRISSWQLTINGEGGEYLRAVVLLRPAGPAYPDVALQIELTWAGDHYDWAGSRTALEACP